MKKLSLLALLILTGCFRVGNELEPQLNYAVQDRYLKSLPSPFPPLTDQEAAQDWGREDRVGLGFAHELDLYQALTSFKRASFLLPPTLTDRKLQIEYDILLCYYYGRKYAETVYTFDSGPLRGTTPTFTPHQDLLVILYDSYLNLQESDKADHVLNYMQSTYPATAQKLSLSKSLLKGDIPTLETAAPSHPDIQALLTQYEQEKKIDKDRPTSQFIPPWNRLPLCRTNPIGDHCIPAQRCFHLGIGLLLPTRQYSRWYHFH